VIEICELLTRKSQQLASPPLEIAVVSASATKRQGQLAWLRIG
jgi:hypothetical protein